MSNKIYYLVLFFLIVIVAILLYLFDSAPSSYRFHKLFYQKAYQGIVKEIYIDSRNHSNKTIKCIYLDNEEKQFRVRTPQGNKYIYNIVRYGDTLIKYAYSNELIIRGSWVDTVSYDLKYPVSTQESQSIQHAIFNLFEKD